MTNLGTVIAPLTGLLVAGGKSRRMGRDKAALPTEQGPLWRRTYKLLKSVCADSAISIRADQTLPGYSSEDGPLLTDTITDAGPLGGILTAFEYKPDHAWMIIACDLPLLDESTLTALIAARKPENLATSYRSNFDGKPEPLCAIYEPQAAPLLREMLGNEHPCPRKFLIRQSAQVSLIDLAQPYALENANTPEDLERIHQLATTIES